MCRLEFKIKLSVGGELRLLLVFKWRDFGRKNGWRREKGFVIDICFCHTYNCALESPLVVITWLTVPVLLSNGLHFIRGGKMLAVLDYINNKLQDLEKEKVTLGLEVKDDRSKDRNRQYETSLLVDASSIVGRQADKDALVQRLLADEPCNKNFSIVPIVGMGGVGKTTLARLLYNEKLVKDHFDLKAVVPLLSVDIERVSPHLYV
ncbi:LRR and NB-ARC domains-containing disease resistance protein [Artemisia annua]|uniref:LRR and NB-ARC domains-containing disease resistance protein n=1 Tax=Artemisia annua TaxID=35608 RepID=A0A2U1MPM8_ARTAN|nr:LRR and NB-ARC domains-containing disease resistance protein [Artemisia annua]